MRDSGSCGSGSNPDGAILSFTGIAEDRKSLTHWRCVRMGATSFDALRRETVRGKRERGPGAYPRRVFVLRAALDEDADAKEHRYDAQEAPAGGSSGFAGDRAVVVVVLSFAAAADGH